MRRLLVILLLSATLSGCVFKNTTLGTVTGALVGLVVWHVYFDSDNEN